MRKEFIGVMLVTAMMAGLAGYGGSEDTSTDAVAADTQAIEAQKEEAKDGAKKEGEKENSEVSDSEGASDFRISIITGSVSQSEDGRRDAETFQAMYGEDMAELVIYPDNFTEELKITIQTIANLSGDPKMRVVIMNQSVLGATEAFRKTRETRPDILCIADEGRENFPKTGSTADLICDNDFVARGYLIIRTAHELGCDTFVCISFPRHMTYETTSCRVAVMKETCRGFGVKFILETTPDPISDVDVAGAQVYIPEKVPEWAEKYGKNTTYLCTNDAHTKSPLKRLMEYDGYSIEADLPPPLTGYPGALGIDLTARAGDFDKILAKVESTIVERGGADHSGTWAYSYGYTIFAGLAQHALDVLSDESELDDTGGVTKAYQVFSPKAEWDGSNYANVETGVKLDNVFLTYQGTYVMDNPEHFVGSIKIEAPGKHFTIKQDAY